MRKTFFRRKRKSKQKSRGGGAQGVVVDPIIELKNVIITSTENPDEFNNPVPGYIVQLTSKNGNGFRDPRYELNGNLNVKFQNDLIRELMVAQEEGKPPEEGKNYKINEKLEKQFKTDKLMNLFVTNKKEFIEEIRKF